MNVMNVEEQKKGVLLAVSNFCKEAYSVFVLRTDLRPATHPRAINGREASHLSLFPHHMRDRCQAVEGRATEADTLATLAMPALPIIWRTLVTPGTAPKGATIQTVDTPTATTRWPPIWAEAPTEAEGMPEAEVTAGSEAGATTWEVSPAGGGGGLGAAGNEAS
jgi:hypothetical protein